MTSKEKKLETSRLIINATDRQGNQLPTLGMAMAWSYSKSEYDQDKVIDAFRVNKLPTQHIEEGAERLDAVKRAVRKAKEKNILREISPGMYQLTEETRNEMAGQTVLEYSMKEIIEYVEEDEEFVFIDENGLRHHDKVRSDELMKRVRHAECVFLVRDVTRYTKELFKNKGIVSLRSSGGLYFVPAKFADLVNDVHAMFQMIDPNAMFMKIEIPDTPNAATAISVSAVDMVKTKVAKLKETIEAHKKERAAKRADGTLKKGKFENDLSNAKGATNLEECAGLAGDVELLAECLGFELDDCKQVVADFKKELLEDLGVESEEQFIKDQAERKQNKKPLKKDKDGKEAPVSVTNPDDDNLDLGEVEDKSDLGGSQGKLMFN